jgi:CTP synthase
MHDQVDVEDMGGTMRLGVYPCKLQEDSLARSAYQQELVYERHRHRYEFNNAYRNLFLDSGYEICGTSPDGRLVEIIELPQNRFFIGCQFHPEFQSSPSQPHPLFKGFIEAAIDRDDRGSSEE